MVELSPTRSFLTTLLHINHPKTIYGEYNSARNYIHISDRSKIPPETTTSVKLYLIRRPAGSGPLVAPRGRLISPAQDNGKSRIVAHRKNMTRRFVAHFPSVKYSPNEIVEIEL